MHLFQSVDLIRIIPLQTKFVLKKKGTSFGDYAGGCHFDPEG